MLGPSSTNYPRSLPAKKGLTFDVIDELGREKFDIYAPLVQKMNQQFKEPKVFVLPTSDAMVLAAKYYHDGKLPGVEGVHTYVGKKDRSLWRDRLGHLGPGFGQLEGYVFYAALYGKSPEMIDDAIFTATEYPSQELDQMFRRIAWRQFFATHCQASKTTTQMESTIIESNFDRYFAAISSSFSRFASPSFSKIDSFSAASSRASATSGLGSNRRSF